MQSWVESVEQLSTTTNSILLENCETERILWREDNWASNFLALLKVGMATDRNG